MRSLKIFIAALFTTLAANAAAPVKEPKVIWVVVDGIRQKELQGVATDDDGKRVRAEIIFPNLMALKKLGVFVPNMKISNPQGVSLPAYADMFAGRRQEKIVNNTPPPEDKRSHYPTIFEAAKNGLGLPVEAVQLHSSWPSTCDVAGSAEIFKSCTWREGVTTKPVTYGDSRADVDTFIEATRELTTRHPRFAFIHFTDADEEAHLQESVKEQAGFYYGIFRYHNALRESDHYVGRLWKTIQADPFYKGSTYLIVTTDHGRDNWPDPDNWANHGRCVRKHGAKETCSGCSHVFAIAVGPGLKRQVAKATYSHIDLAPTVAKLLGVEMPSAIGRAIGEISPSR